MYKHFIKYCRHIYDKHKFHKCSWKKKKLRMQFSRIMMMFYCTFQKTITTTKLAYFLKITTQQCLCCLQFTGLHVHTVGITDTTKLNSTKAELLLLG
jgi:hypothetical protein